MRLEELVPFFDYARETGALPSNAVHNFSGAISAIAHCLSPDERTVEFVQTGGDALRGRLVTGKPDISPKTIDAYVNRASAAISHFNEWKKDPVRWEKETTTKPRRKRRRQSFRKLALADNTIAPVVESAAPRASALRRSLVQIPTEEGKTISAELPDDFCMNDVIRVLWALAAQSRDFDPEVLLNRIGKPSMARGEQHD